MKNTTILIACVLAACSRQRDVAPGDYSHKRNVHEVEDMVPDDLKTAYQQLFSCRFDEETRRTGRQPVIDPRFAGSILDAVRADPEVGRKCLAQERAGNK